MATSPQIPLSQLIASDAPLLSPVLNPEPSPWDHMDGSTFNFCHGAPASPSRSMGSHSAMLISDPEPQLCISTQQVFDLSEDEEDFSPVKPPPKLSISIKPRAVQNPPAKRSASPPPTVAKKPRASSGERPSSRDFIPPDVSGLSKREARLVKNRAAAFLSRQRKREEFEAMEVRLAELEEENARLLALTQAEAVPQGPEVLVSEVEKLRAQLAAAEERERELSAKLGTATDVKIETEDLVVPASTKSSPLRSSASLGLMVLLCALPSLLSMPPSNGHMSTSISSSALLSSTAAPPSAFDYNSFISSDFDWARDFSSSGIMDLDIDDQGRISAPSDSVVPVSAQSLAFDTDGEPTTSALLGQLGQLDISFDASQTENGKIRVRIHPSGTNSDSRASTPPRDSIMKDEPSDYLMSQDSISDPFLGVGPSPSEWLDDLPMPGGYDHQSPGWESEFDSCSTTSGSSSSGKRRVRIALKSAPASGGEGGEWEVQFY